VAEGQAPLVVRPALTSVGGGEDINHVARAVPEFDLHDSAVLVHVSDDRMLGHARRLRPPDQSRALKRPEFELGLFLRGIDKRLHVFEPVRTEAQSGPAGAVNLCGRVFPRKRQKPLPERPVRYAEFRLPGTVRIPGIPRDVTVCSAQRPALSPMSDARCRSLVAPRSMPPIFSLAMWAAFVLNRPGSAFAWTAISSKRWLSTRASSVPFSTYGF
jgi:hypothetical protein